MIELTPAQAGRALGRGPLAAPVTGVSIDTRSLRAGDMFVALQGERFDGHDFVGAALAAGASALVVRREQREGPRAKRRATTPRSTRSTTPCRRSGALPVKCAGTRPPPSSPSPAAWARPARRMLWPRWSGRVRRVVATAANQNNEIGVALTLLSIEPDTEAVVVEMGMRGLGQIAQLAEVAEPDVGVITNVHPVHLELLGSMEHIAQAKAELVGGSESGGVAVVPAGCELLQPYVAAHRGPGRALLDRSPCRRCRGGRHRSSTAPAGARAAT